MNSIVLKLESILEKQVALFDEESNDYLKKDIKAKLNILISGLNAALSVLFLLELHLPFGIENERVIEAYSLIENTFNYLLDN